MTRTDLAALGGVAVAGIAGGFGFWLLGQWAGTSMFPGFSRLGQIGALMFIGAIAAAIGVYVLTASDMAWMRTYVFALICGLVWQPIIDSGKRVATNVAVNGKVARLNNSADQLSNASSLPTSQVSERIKSTLPVITEALQAAPGVQDTSKQDDIANSSSKAIDAIVQAAPKAPDASLKALTEISAEAARNGQTDVAVKAVQGVRTIGFSAAQQKNDAVAKNAAGSLSMLAVHVPNTTVKAAAGNSAQSIQMKMSEVAKQP